MPNNFLRAVARVNQSNTDDPATPVRFVASTEGVKSDGFDLRMEDWTLDRYLTHPVILFAHDVAASRFLPIGTGQPSFEGRDLMMDVTFDTEDEFAMKVRGKTMRGMMGGSVNWETVLQAGKRKNQLLEFSIVPVPLDAAALPQTQGRGLYEYGKRLMDSLQAFVEDDGADVDPASADWPKAATEMVRLFLEVPSDADDAERRKQYNRLAVKYRKAGKTAPEFMPAAELQALEAKDVAGLFLEGEPALVRADGASLTMTQACSMMKACCDTMAQCCDLLLSGDAEAEEEMRQCCTMVINLCYMMFGLMPSPYGGMWSAESGNARAGAVLSTRNKSNLEQAQGLIQTVLDSAKKEDAPAADENADAERSETEDEAHLRSILDSLTKLGIKGA